MTGASDIEQKMRVWVQLRRQYAMSQRMSTPAAVIELDKDYLRWRLLSPAECLGRYRSPRIKEIVEQLMRIIDDQN